jgi:hypothetical protein
LLYSRFVLGVQEFEMSVFQTIVRVRALALVGACTMSICTPAIAESADDPPSPPASIGPAALMNVTGGRPHVHVDGHQCTLTRSPVAMPKLATFPLPVVLQLAPEKQKKDRLERVKKAANEM